MSTVTSTVGPQVFSKSISILKKIVTTADDVIRDEFRVIITALLLCDRNAKQVIIMSHHCKHEYSVFDSERPPVESLSSVDGMLITMFSVVMNSHYVIEVVDNYVHLPNKNYSTQIWPIHFFNRQN